MVGLYRGTPTERLSNEEENGRGTRLSRQAFEIEREETLLIGVAKPGA